MHLGKHGNLEWLPGKTLGMSAACGADAALGDLPLIYPFLVNDPGEGTQAKRRAHAVLVDHLIPPMARAETYGDIARLEQLLDEHATIAALDPAKLPAIRQQIWTLIQAAKMDHDLGLAQRPHDEQFDDMLLHVDGWLCEIKDVQIRDGLHILGHAPEGEHRAGPGTGDPAGATTVGRRPVAARAAPGARARRGHDRPRRRRRRRGDSPSIGRRAAEGGMGAHRGRHPHRRSATSRRSCGSPPPKWCRGWRAPRTRSTKSYELWTAGSSRPGRRGRRYAGWSTCCPPAATSTPSTRRPCRRGWPGKPVWPWRIRCWRATARRQGSGRSRSGCRCGAPRRCGHPVTTSPKCLRCLAFSRHGTTHRGGSPGWRRCRLPSSDRPRIDVTVRISGFFRDAFPHVVTMLDDAVRLAAEPGRGPGRQLRPRPRASRPRRTR